MKDRAVGRTVSRVCAVLLCVALAACGDLPEPFLGNPGATGRQLAQPTAPLLVVPPSGDTLLPDAANGALADQLARQLQGIEVPAVSRPAQPHEWRLATVAHLRDGMVTPTFAVIDPAGRQEGMVAGEAVTAKDWSEAAPSLIARVAAGAAPRIGAALSDIRLAHDKADPNSLYNRAARVMVDDVTGAPGDGDEALTRQMRARLALLGPVVVTTAADADFVVKGHVAMAKVPGLKQRVEIQWSVQIPSGDERGKVIQLNEVPAGTLDHAWGDVAVAVAAEASGGVNDVIRRQSGRVPTDGAAAKATGPATVSQAGPNQAGPNQAGPDQAGPAQAGADQAGPAQAGPDQAGAAHAADAAKR